MITRLITIIAITISSPLVWADAYYWVDEDGKRHYSDRVPPADSKRERKVIDDRGFTVETLPEERTAEEQKAIDRAEAKARREKQLTEKQRRESIAYDNLLITSYQSVTDIEKARDNRLGLLDASILVEVQTHSDNLKRLNALKDKEKALVDNGKPVSDKFSKRLKQARYALSVNESNIAELKRQRAETEAKYSRDIKRYNELKLAAED